MKELLIKLLEFTVRNQQYVHSIGYGLCNYITYMRDWGKITPEEAVMTHKYLHKNKPEHHEKYMPYYWEEKDMESRLTYLQHHINKL